MSIVTKWRVSRLPPPSAPNLLPSSLLFCSLSFSSISSSCSALLVSSTMTFDFCDPKPPTVYSNPLTEFYEKFANNSESTLGGPLDRYDTTGGSFPPRISRCSLTSDTPKRNEKSYIGRYLRTNLLATNPATLCAVKNTRILRSLLEHPPLNFTPAKAARGSCRSTTHFELNARHERTLCAITENLRDEQKNRRTLDLQKRAQTLQKFVHDTRSEQSSENSVKRILTKQTKVRLSGGLHSTRGTASFAGGRKRSSDGTKSTLLIDICQKGDLLTHIRQNVERRIERMDLEDVGAIKHILPETKDIPFAVEESRGEEHYEFHSHGAMASLCSTKRSANVFYESRSKKELQRERKASLERLQRMSMMPWQGRVGGGATKEVAFSPSLLTTAAKVQPPSPEAMKGALKMSVRPKEKWSHLGLIEEAKKDILRDTCGKLERRELVETPRELSMSHYGPLKDVPENPMRGPLLPLHLAVKGFPPTREELERVERQGSFQKALDKEKRRRRSEEKVSFYAPYAKALLTDSEEEGGYIPHELDDIEGQPERLADLLDASILMSGLTPTPTRRTLPRESTSLRLSQPPQSVEKSVSRVSKPSASPVHLPNREQSSRTSVGLKLSKSSLENDIERKLPKSSVENDIERKSSVSSLENDIERKVSKSENDMEPKVSKSENDMEPKVSKSENDMEPKVSKSENGMEPKVSNKLSVKKSTTQSLQKKVSRSQPQTRFTSEIQIGRKLSKSSLEMFVERRESEVDRVIASAARTPEEAEEDVAFSDIAVPKIEGIHDAVFYRSLALGELSSSGNSDDETDLEEEEETKEEKVRPLVTNQYSIIAILEKDDEDEEEALEEEETPSSTTFKTAEDDEVTRRMREMLGDNLDVEAVFRTDPVWRRLQKVEKVPKQIHLREEESPNPKERRKEAELHPHLQQALYDFKGMKEEQRVRQEKEVQEQLRREVTRYRTSVFGVYTHKKKKSKVYKRLFLKQRVQKRAKSVYELSPLLKTKSRKTVTSME